jgi:hypothetical protein
METGLSKFQQYLFQQNTQMYVQETFILIQMEDKKQNFICDY